ncbi:mitochondrial or chloroplast ribosomal protein L18 precursor [Klebsormidium nitens]|uniref:Large ribosomal subunit protein uL18c n=1 Tax=Klebsormidium nitens TaxID=105231 RepID=A0A1Y1IC37_KLENI|nr:mitochondrial or chloroplast ribosomal protein L18 precursor [Klebsormidium nitens]|eukprot:GAQ88143.1 mitochondrial or chloroplast ribosomal protein L18 precursor [Klebsormidium nitens]
MAAVALAKGSCLGAAIRTPAIPSASTSSRDAVFRSFSGLTLSEKMEQSVPALRSTAAKVAPLQIGLLVEAKLINRKELRLKRHRRIRKKISGTSDRPRMAVYRSNAHIYVQVIDDENQCTIAASSTVKKGLRETLEKTAGATCEHAAAVGKDIAEQLLAKGINAVKYDRGGFVFHGRIKALADAAREAGVVF